MQVLPLDAAEARALIEAVAKADTELPSGREFWFEVERVDGEVFCGQRDTSDETTLTLLDDRTAANERRTVKWDEIQRICVASHT